jgi:hypothetical protein
MPLKRLASIVSGLGLPSRASQGSPVQRVLLGAVLVAPILTWSPTSWAVDVWDQTGSDSGPDTVNELAPGSSQVHDMQATPSTPTVPDQDWYRVSQKPYSSYEVVVDGTTEGMGSIPVTNPGDELAVDLMTFLTLARSSQGLGASGAARGLYFQNETAAAKDNQLIRVSSAACDTFCGANHQYKIHFLDTTYSVPRFNNSASQVTILIIQNTSLRNVLVKTWFFNSSGALFGSFATSIQARGSLVLNTSTVAGVSGNSGSIIVTHDGRYGSLDGKAVSLEAATGFTFDTALVPRSQ